MNRLSFSQDGFSKTMNTLPDLVKIPALVTVTTPTGHLKSGLLLSVTTKFNHSRNKKKGKGRSLP